MIRFEYLVIAIGKMNGAWDDPSSKAFKLRNPLLLKTYRPEKKCDSEHIREFTSFCGGLKAGYADLLAKCNATNNKLTLENTLGDLLQFYGFRTSAQTRPIVLFLRRAMDDSVSIDTPLAWFSQEDKLKEGVVNA